MKNYDVEMLRAELNEYSPEQQKEKDDESFKEALKTFSELVAEMKQCGEEMQQCGEDLTKMKVMMQNFPIIASRACVLRVTQLTRKDYTQLMEEVVQRASLQISKLFDEKVAVVNRYFDQRLAQMKREEHRVSLPAYLAYSLCFSLAVVVVMVGIFIYVNYAVYHDKRLWVVTWSMIAVLLWVLVVLAYCGYRKWL